MNLSWGVSHNGALIAAFSSKHAAEEHAIELRKLSVRMLSDRMSSSIAVVELQPSKFLRIKEVVLTTAMSKPWIYEQMMKGEFPRSIQIGSGRANVWIESEVDEWKRRIIRDAMFKRDSHEKPRSQPTAQPPGAKASAAGEAKPG